jgi:Fibronectin type III domain
MVAASNYGTRFALAPSCSSSCSAPRTKLTETNPNLTVLTPLEQHMSGLTMQQSFLVRTRVTRTSHMPQYLTAIVTGLLLSVLPLLTGCGAGGETGSDPSVTVTPSSAGGAPTASASLTWNPVQDSSVSPPVSAYFVHYGRQSTGHSGSCAYESSMHSSSPSATVTDLDPNTVYYFAVSAYNGLESACSNEVSTQTPPAST